MRERTRALDTYARRQGRLLRALLSRQWQTVQQLMYPEPLETVGSSDCSRDDHMMPVWAEDRESAVS